MLAELVNEVQQRQQELRGKIAAAENFRQRARELWRRYEPRAKASRLIGVDSGWNYRAFQGYFLYAVDAAALFQDGERACEPMYEVDVGTLMVREGNRVGPRPKLYLMSKGMEFEYKLALRSYDDDKADYVLVDGSLLARYYDMTTFKTTRLIDYFTDLMGRDRLIFVSKASYSTRLLRGELGDAAYFNLLVPWAGYTEPAHDEITFFYARFADHTPALRVEIPAPLSEQEVREVIDVLAFDQANGYPNVLRLVDREVRVSREHLKMLAQLLGLEAEAGARDVLA